ncbi:hypothetical protein ABER99_21650 [Paenibacillus glucanolyticus]|jgi:hypothetical protein|uniref:TraD/TraG TraM recognition site domain-containing protein n=1 Tax=Paenibacillus glucanolyticus TaxID=59843 RepID=A0A163GSE6_9BACL|nr:hypothetical protein [Paenibacillus glucanolyticus]KZS45126.1 hypothetical protein AWU65_03855 [Paenibacillus glucanolyticus]OMF65149.1 hypothetical protein BK142_31190 [Paenibacillus glucanolyticus]
MFQLFKTRKQENNDLVLGWSASNNKPIALPESLRFQHEVVLGIEGTGKSSIHLLRRITHDLLSLSRGDKRSIVVLEEDGGLLSGAQKQMNRLGITPSQVKLLNAVDPKFESGWNPLLEERAAEILSRAIASSLANCEENLKDFIEHDCRWMVRLVKAYYSDRANLIYLNRLYSDPRYLADIVEEMTEREGYRENTEWQTITDYFKHHVLDYLEHEDDGILVPTRYPEGHYYEGLQVVISKHNMMNYEVIRFFEDITNDKGLMRVLNSTSSFRVSKVLNESKIVFIRTSKHPQYGSFLGNLFINALSVSFFEKTSSTVELPCFLTIDDAQAYDLSPINYLMDSTVNSEKLSISLSFQRYQQSNHHIIQKVKTITGLKMDYQSAEAIINIIHSSFQETSSIKPNELMQLDAGTFVIWTCDTKTARSKGHIAQAPHALNCRYMDGLIASHEARKMLL